MSLDYGYIFSQIDKAKKKRKRWTQADTDAAMAKLAEEKEARGPVVSQRRYRRNPGGKNKPETHRSGTGGSFKKEKPLPKQGGKDAGPQAAHSSSIVEGKTSESRTRNKVPFKGEKRIADVGTEDEGKIHRGTDRKGLPRNFQREKDRRDAKDAEKKQQEKDLKEGIPGWHSTLDPKSHIKYRMVTDAKGNRVKVQVTERSRDHQDNKKPIGRKQELRRESGTFNIKDPVEANRRLAAADRKFEKERDTTSTTSYREFLRDRKKNPPPSGGFISAEESDEESHVADYRKWVADRAAKRAKREADKKERESIDPKTKLPKGPKRIEPPRKDRKKKPTEGDPNPEVEGGIDGDSEYDDFAPVGKSLWKSWLKEKDAVSGKQSKTRKPKGNKATRGGRGISDNTKEGQATDARHLDTPRGSKGTHIRTNMSDVLGDIKNRVSPKLWGYEAHQEKKWKKEGKQGESRAPRPQGHGVSQRGNQSRRDRIVPKKVPEDWKKIDDAVQTDRAKELEERAGKGIPYGKSLWKAWLKEKAEEGIGGMNMGSQRGLGHDAGYKQDPGESAQITEVKEKTDKCPECKSKLVVPGDYKSSKEKRGHKIRYCDDCGHEWEKKSAYENHEQDESPDSQPNKQQIPPSKPGMDALKVYKKALIIKYNNIYKPANI